MKTFKFFALTLTFLFSALGAGYAQRSVEQDITNIKAAYDALNRKDWAAFAALSSPNYTEVNVGGAPVTGIQAALDLYKGFQAGFPDFMVKINDIVPAGKNRYLLRVSITGTNTGNFMMLPPTGKPIKFEDADVVTLDDNGKCLSHMITNTGESFRQIGYGSMFNPSTQAVIAVYEKFGKGDVPGILAASTDDVVFEIQDRMFDSKARWFKGKAEAGRFFQELGGKFQYSKFQPTRFVADGDDVFVLVDVEYKLIATGQTYTSTYTHRFKIVNGKVAYFRGVDDFQMMK
jgi:ketosteroid isomerase-like protein